MNYLLGVLLLVIAGMGLALYDQSGKLAAADRALAEQEAINVTLFDDLKAAQKVSEADSKTIRDLADKLATEVKSRKTVEASAAEASRLAAANARARDRYRDELTTLRGKLYETDPDCDAWRRAGVCAAVSDGVRKLWNETRAIDDAVDQDAGGGGDKPPVHPAAIGPDRADDPAAASSWLDRILPAPVPLQRTTGSGTDRRPARDSGRQ